MAYNDHRARESGPVSPLLEAVGQRSLSAVLTGCRLEVGLGCELFALRTSEACGEVFD